MFVVGVLNGIMLMLALSIAHAPLIMFWADVVCASTYLYNKYGR